jgi:transposase InsO family protein
VSAFGRLGRLAATAIEDSHGRGSLGALALGTLHQLHELLDGGDAVLAREPLDAEHVLRPPRGTQSWSRKSEQGDKWSFCLTCPRTTKPEPGHKIYPYLLRGMEIVRPNQVWAMDITYIPMARGFVYLAVVLDWFSRRVLSWDASITMEASFCVETLEDALARHGKPDIFNTDQGSQFTGSAFTGVLASNGIAISMDGKGAWRDNVFVERLWRSVRCQRQFRPAP